MRRLLLFLYLAMAVQAAVTSQVTCSAELPSGELTITDEFDCSIPMPFAPELAPWGPAIAYSTVISDLGGFSASVFASANPVWDVTLLPVSGSRAKAEVNAEWSILTDGPLRPGFFRYNYGAQTNGYGPRWAGAYLTGADLEPAFQAVIPITLGTPLKMGAYAYAEGSGHPVWGGLGGGAAVVFVYEILDESGENVPFRFADDGPPSDEPGGDPAPEVPEPATAGLVIAGTGIVLLRRLFVR